MIKPATPYKFTVEQVSWVSAVQGPLYTTDVIGVAPDMLSKLILCVVLVAINLNHTSSSIPAALQLGTGAVPEGVALAVLPAVTMPHK